MSGALISLVAKGVQDAYLSDNGGTSLFSIKYNRHTNFAQAPKRLPVTSGSVSSNETCVIPLSRLGDLINCVWLEGDDLVDNLGGTIFELHIGGQTVDTQTYEFMSEIWQVYLADSASKARTINNVISKSNNKFFPLHFFFCDNGLFLPLVAMQYTEAEIHIKWGPSVDDVQNLKAYGNFVYLDTDEREKMAQKEMSMIITQTQKVLYSSDQELDLAYFNHPVKALFFGLDAVGPNILDDNWTFDTVDMYLNGKSFLEEMSPTYFHTVQGYYHTKYGVIAYDTTQNTPEYTRYFMYSFALDASSFAPTGTCNFSRLDNAKMILKNIVRGSDQMDSPLNIYAASYNILRFKMGIAGILFSN